jgi:hypothetical protein
LWLHGTEIERPLAIALDDALGWWWADPLVALGMTYFLVTEGRAAWQGEDRFA